MKKNNNVYYGFIGKEKDNIDVFRKKKLGNIFSNFLDKKIVFMKQIHSDNIEIVDQRDEYDRTDAMITTRKNVVLTGTFADCAPIYFYVKNKDIVALAHSGWRGSKLGIAIKVIDKLISKFDLKAEDIFVIIGPCISLDNYEVKKDFLVNFDSRYFVYIKDKIYFDLKRYNYDIISSVIPKENISIDSRCTFEDESLHSYRRDKQTSGRNIAFIYTE